MKVLAAVIVCVLMMTSCTKNDGDLSDLMQLRRQLASSEGCSFTSEVTADYGDRVYTFIMDCKANASGDVRFQIVEPQTISGITGTVSQSGGRLEFDDQVLIFESLTQGQLTPAVGPWLLIKVITGGYIRSASKENECMVYTINDTFGSENVMALLTLRTDSTPVFCEIFWNNRRILSMRISNFQDL